jgi:subtilisin family serine protease
MRLSTSTPSRRNFRLIPTLLALALLISLFSASSVQATPQLDPQLSRSFRVDALMQKAQFEPVRLLVTLDAAFQPEGAMAINAVNNQRAAISAVSNRVTSGLATAKLNYKLIAAYDAFPVIALEADKATLIHLANLPEVKYIQEDIPEAPTDVSSGNLIGLSNVISAGWTGSGWTVAVLDTGVQTSHPFLSGKVVAEACFSTTSGTSSVSVCPNGASTSGNTPGQTGAGAGRNCTVSGCEHGTHVAGIALGKNFSGGPGYEGVARDATLIAVQVFSRFNSSTDCGGTAPCVLAYNSDVLAALNWVYGLRTSYNIASVNMSLGGGGYTSACDTDARKPAVDNLRSANIATVIAAGNNGYTNRISAPGCISTAVSVGATTDTDTVASYSNRASFMSIYAPGSTIDSSIPTNTYANYNGTSMAAPHVAGAWAAMKQKYPTWTVSQVLTQLQNTGVSITNSGFTRPRMKLDSAIGGGPPPTATPIPATATPTRTATPGGSTNVSYNGTFTSTCPKYRRTNTGTPPTSLNSSATNVCYGAQAFRVAVSGTYTMTMTAGTFTNGSTTNDDGFFTLYQTTFTPSNALTNAKKADDDSGPGYKPAMSFSLTAGTTYVLVSTTYGNGYTGTYTNNITGPGSITLTTGGVSSFSGVPGILVQPGVDSGVVAPGGGGAD